MSVPETDVHPDNHETSYHPGAGHSSEGHQHDVTPPGPGGPGGPAGPVADDSLLVRLLTPSGQRLSGTPYDPFIADVTAADLLGLLRDMVIARRIDDEATALQRQGELGLWASLRGQEAAQVGSARALRAGDMVFPSYREHAVAWCRGVDLLDVLGMFRGVAHGGWDVTRHGMQAYAVVVGSQTLHATGYAMGVAWENAARLRVAAAGSGARAGEGPDDDIPATVVYFGDGASSQGDVNEAFNWAGVFGAPMVFVCQNNHWAISAPSRRQSRVPIYRRGCAFGLEGVRVDGNDVLAMLAVTRRALQAARGGRPTLIEAVTYRMGAHTTADDPSRYRDADEVARWSRRDPILRMKAHLRHLGVLDDRAEDDLDSEAEAIAGTLRRRCLSLPDPPAASLFDHVYAQDIHERAVQEHGSGAPVPACAPDGWSAAGAGGPAGDDRGCAYDYGSGRDESAGLRTGSRMSTLPPLPEPPIHAARKVM